MLLSITAGLDFSAQAAVYKCGYWDYTKLSSTEVAISGYRGSETEVNIPSQLDGYKVTEIASATFIDNSYIENVIIPNTVRYIGEEAFNDCNSMYAITIPEGVEKIDNYAFRYCSSLVDITLPESVTELGNGLFSWCKSLRNVKIKSKITVLPWGTFEGVSLNNLELPNTLLEIEAGVFNGFNIDSIVIPVSVKKINRRAFIDCKIKKIIVYSRDCEFASNSIGGDMNYGYKNSSFERYCQENNLKFACIECMQGHSYNITEKAPTCTTAGTKTYTCSVCGDSKKESVSAKGHSFNGVKCTNCGIDDPNRKNNNFNTSAKPKATCIKEVNASKKQFNVTWKKVSGVTGYQVQYSTDKKFKKGTKTVTVKGAKKTSTIVKKLKSKKTYYVRIRTYKGKNYSAWSKAKSVKIK